MATQLHNFKNIFITSSPDSEATSVDCQAVKRLTRALFPLLWWHRYLFAWLRESPNVGHLKMEVGAEKRERERRSPGLPVEAKPVGVCAWPVPFSLSGCPCTGASSSQMPPCAAQPRANPSPSWRLLCRLVTNLPASPAWDPLGPAGPERREFLCFYHRHPTESAPRGPRLWARRAGQVPLRSVGSEHAPSQTAPCLLFS